MKPPRKTSRKAVRIQDVAKAAGVSTSTVSRVLNDKDDVSPETYERVQRIIKELGYTSSLAARGMRSRRTNVIGLVMPDIATPYSAAVMRGANRGIAQLDYDLIVYTNGDIRKNTSADQGCYYVALLNGSIADGVVIVTPTATNFSTSAPVVAIDPNNESPECPAIIATNYDGAFQVMEYLLGLGHNRIGFITGRLDLVSSNQRLQGYKDGLKRAGIPLNDELIRTGDYTTETAVECARMLLTLEQRPTAIFAANDMSAMGVYQVADELGLNIPDDVSVVGFDDIQDASFLRPPLTTISQFVSEMGYVAIRMIVKLINNEPLESDLYTFSTQLVVRESCQSVKSRGFS